jgi:hypothetical protein
MSILKDRIRPLDPSSLQKFLEPDGGAETEVRTAEPLATAQITTAENDRASHRPDLPLGETSFELASRGGYVRTVTGTVAYLDDDAQTYMVSRLNGDGELLRVPLRDITSSHVTATNGQPRSDQDAEGLGTG